MCLGEHFPLSYKHMFVTNSLEWVLEKDSKKRKALGELFFGFLASKALTYSDLKEGYVHILYYWHLVFGGGGYW